MIDDLNAATLAFGEAHHLLSEVYFLQLVLPAFGADIKASPIDSQRSAGRARPTHLRVKRAGAGPLQAGLYGEPGFEPEAGSAIELLKMW